MSLARAVYNDADVYLLDDPLSAVDAHVGEHIFNRCIKETLKGKTVLLVTHHVHVLPACDKVVILENDGSMKAFGSLEEVRQSGVDIDKYVSSGAKEPGDGEKEEGVTAEEQEEGAAEREARRALSSAENKIKRAGRAKAKSEASSNEEASGGGAGDKEHGKKQGEVLMTVEEKNDGLVPTETYLFYITSGGTAIFMCVMLFQMCSQTLSVYSNFWLVDCGKETTIDNFEGHDMSRHRNLHWLNGYAGMQMASIFFLLLARLALTYFRTSAASRMHENLLRRVMFFPVSFFDVTPVGRIINRFSQDTVRYLLIVLFWHFCRYYTHLLV